MVLSITLVRTGVMEMGRKSAYCLGGATLGIGRMEAVFHCCGMVEVAREKFNNRAIGLLKASSLRNQVGSPSNPVAV